MDILNEPSDHTLRGSLTLITNEESLENRIDQEGEITANEPERNESTKVKDAEATANESLINESTRVQDAEASAYVPESNESTRVRDAEASANEPESNESTRVQDAEASGNKPKSSESTIAQDDEASGHEPESSELTRVQAAEASANKPKTSESITAQDDEASGHEPGNSESTIAQPECQREPPMVYCLFNILDQVAEIVTSDDIFILISPSDKYPTTCKLHMISRKTRRHLRVLRIWKTELEEYQDQTKKHKFIFVYCNKPIELESHTPKSEGIIKNLCQTINSAFRPQCANRAIWDNMIKLVDDMSDAFRTIDNVPETASKEL